MLAVSHDNALLEPYHVGHFGHERGNKIIGDRLEKLSPMAVEMMEDEHHGFHLSSVFGDENDGFSDGLVKTTAATNNASNYLDSALENEIEHGDGEEPFFICDLGIVVKQFDKWKALLPRVEPFYAIKCNTDPGMLDTLVNMGAGFDCASKTEIAIMLNMGVDPSRIIYANPCKPASHIRYAREKGVAKMTFDNLTELVKIKEHFPEAELVLRVITDDSKSLCQFSVKFGAPMSSVETLLMAAKSMELNVIGVSFHVGSGCLDASQYDDALKSARFVFDKAQEIGFPAMNFLDIGGGYPGIEKEITLAEIATAVNKALDAYFPAWQFPTLSVIAEPGRYFATAAFTLAVSVTSRRVTMANNSEPQKFMYYLNDGIYGSFNCVFFDHVAVISPEIMTQHGRFLSRQPSTEKTLYSSSLWGPTCDSIDCISKEMELPELDVGDWLVFRNMGAYTIAAATTFNGFPCTKVIYINRDAWRESYHFYFGSMRRAFCPED